MINRSNNRQERDHELMERGSQATALLGFARSSIDDQMRTTVQLMINLYRQGDVPHGVIMGKVGELAALQTLINELETRQRLGDNAANRELS